MKHIKLFEDYQSDLNEDVNEKFYRVDIIGDRDANDHKEQVEFLTSQAGYSEEEAEEMVLPGISINYHKDKSFTKEEAESLASGKVHSKYDSNSDSFAYLTNIDQGGAAYPDGISEELYMSIEPEKFQKYISELYINDTPVLNIID